MQIPSNWFPEGEVQQHLMALSKYLEYCNANEPLADKGFRAGKLAIRELLSVQFPKLYGKNFADEVLGNVNYGGSGSFFLDIVDAVRETIETIHENARIADSIT